MLFRSINAINRTMNFSIQPLIKDNLPLYKWLRLSTSKFKTTEYFIKMCIDICKSIIYIHSFNLVHGDIKPDNILIDVHTNIPYIIDFGLSGINKISEGTGGTRPFCCPETNNTSDDNDDCYFWTRNNKYYDLWSIAFIFASIIIFKNIYNNYTEYPSDYFTENKYITLNYLLRIPSKFREPFILVLSKKSDIDLINFTRILEESLYE